MSSSDSEGDDLAGAADEGFGEDDPSNRPMPRRDAEIPERETEDDGVEDTPQASTEAGTTEQTAEIASSTQSTPEPSQNETQPELQSEPSTSGGENTSQKDQRPPNSTAETVRSQAEDESNHPLEAHLREVKSFELDDIPEDEVDFQSEFAFIHDRDGTHDSRRHIAFHVLPHTERALDRAHRVAEDVFGDVDEADIREAVAMHGLDDLPQCLKRLYAWGYRPE